MIFFIALFFSSILASAQSLPSLTTTGPPPFYNHKCEESRVVLDKVTNGYWLQDFFPDGRKKTDPFFVKKVTDCEIDYSKSHIDGQIVIWNNDGNKLEEMNFKNGDLEGVTIGWYPNGNKRVEVNYHKGIMCCGLAQNWYENGQLFSKVMLGKNGQMIGILEYFNDDGTKRSEVYFDEDGNLSGKKRY